MIELTKPQSTSIRTEFVLVTEESGFEHLVPRAALELEKAGLEWDMTYADDKLTPIISRRDGKELSASVVLAESPNG